MKNEWVILEVERTNGKINCIRGIFRRERGYYYYKETTRVRMEDKIVAEMGYNLAFKSEFVVKGFDLEIKRGKRYITAVGKYAHYYFPVYPNVKIEEDSYHFWYRVPDQDWEVHLWVKKDFAQGLLLKYRKPPKITVEEIEGKVYEGEVCERCGSPRIKWYQLILKEKRGFEEKKVYKDFYVCMNCFHSRFIEESECIWLNEDLYIWSNAEKKLIKYEDRW